jgi:arylsulfatase A-like enzyme
VCDYDPTGAYDNVIDFTMDFFHRNLPTHIHCDRFIPGRHSSELLADATLDFLDAHLRTIPFFAYTAFLAPHDPRTMPKEYLDLYDPDRIPLPASYLPSHPFDIGVSGIRDEQLAGFPRTSDEIRRHIRDYYAMITHLDAQIGRILDRLEQQGRLDHTIVVLAGDNGLAVGRHGLMGKQNLYDHSIRVPLVLCGPGIPRGQRCDAPVLLSDLFPTLCDLCGIPVPPSVEGTTLMPLLRDPSARVREDIYLAYADLLRGVTDGRHKLIETCGPVRRTQLFDLEVDPWELEDRSESPDSTQQLEVLRNRLHRLGYTSDDRLHPAGESFWRRYEGA